MNLDILIAQSTRIFQNTLNEDNESKRSVEYSRVLVPTFHILHEFT